MTIEETSPVDRLEILVRAFGLSARETELASLKSIFAKTSSHNRRTLLSRALGVQDHQAPSRARPAS